MQRYRYKKSYGKLYPRKRWASNIFTENNIVTLLASQNTAFASTTICTNSPQTATPTPVIVKFGRCKVKGDVRTDLDNGNNFVSATLYLAYVPEGYPIADLPKLHPEYIIGWTQISLDSGNTFSFTSSLKRNLNSGDMISILFHVNSVNSTQSARNFNFYYTSPTGLSSCIIIILPTTSFSLRGAFKVSGKSYTIVICLSFVLFCVQ